jgi:hypothetical protein
VGQGVRTRETERGTVKGRRRDRYLGVDLRKAMSTGRKVAIIFEKMFHLNISHLSNLLTATDKDTEISQTWERRRDGSTLSSWSWLWKMTAMMSEREKEPSVL